MATASAGPNGRVDIQISSDEAATLMVILDHINGDPVNSPRRESNAVYFALVNATGARSEDLPQHELMANHEALGFTFKNFDGTMSPLLQKQIDAEKKGVQAYDGSDGLQSFLNSLLP